MDTTEAMNYLPHELHWDEELWGSPEARYVFRSTELHDELENLRRAAERGDKGAARLIFRMSKMWCVHCAVIHAPLMEAQRQSWSALMEEEDAYCKRTGERLVVGTEFLKENPDHEISCSRAGRARLQYVKDSKAYAAAREAEDAQARAVSSGPARGGPTQFYFDPTLELKENVKKARKLDLEGWDKLSLAQHCELAHRWARYSDHKAGTKQPRKAGRLA